MIRCVSFFNFGNKCILELLVATYTLRKYRNKEIVWILDKNDEWNKLLANQVANLNVTIRWEDFNLIKRNAKSAIKPYLFKTLFDAGYDSVIMCDGDLLFLKPIDDLFYQLEIEGGGALLTQFCDWKTNGNIMRKRIMQMKGVINSKLLKDLVDNPHEAVNIGVMGFTREEGSPLLAEWTRITAALAGKHIADEVAAHALVLDTTTIIVPASYNASAKIGDLSHIEDNHVVHFHGGSQGGGDVDLRYEDRRRSSRLWMAHLHEFYESGLVPEAKMWEQYATGGIHEILQANPNLPFECNQEFKM